MAGMTLAQAESNLALWIAASEAVSKKQSYAIAGRSLTLADASEVTKMIDYWQGWVNRLSPASGVGGRRIRYGVVA